MNTERQVIATLQSLLIDSNPSEDNAQDRLIIRRKALRMQINNKGLSLKAVEQACGFKSGKLNNLLSLNCDPYEFEYDDWKTGVYHIVKGRKNCPSTVKGCNKQIELIDSILDSLNKAVHRLTQYRNAQ